VSGTLSKIAEISSDLYNVHKKFNGTVKSHKWDRMQDVYAAINQSMVTWEKSLRKQVDTMQNYMLKSFKYSLKEFESFNEVVKLRNTAGQEYFKSWVDLENRKEKLFLAGEVQKWEIDFKDVKLTPEDVLKNKKVAKMLMLPQVAPPHQQSASLKQMQKVFGYMNTQMLEQSEFVGLKRAKRYVRALTELCNEHIENYSETSMNLTNLNNLMCNIFRKICDSEKKLVLEPQPQANYEPPKAK
jgi:hypothetical protein